MNTSLWTVTTNIYDVPLTMFFDCYYIAESFLRRDCDNGEIDNIVFEHDEPLNYSDGCTWAELTRGFSIRAKDVTKRYNVLRYGMKTQMSYEHVCGTMGINPDVNWIKITNRGTISFTCGHPYELRDLLREIGKCGYKPSQKLVKAVYG